MAGLKKEHLFIYVLLQDYMEPALQDRGTLYHARTLFNHHGVKKETKDCFNHLWDFIQFVTMCLICLAASAILCLGDSEEYPSDTLPRNGPPDVLEAFIHNVARKMVNLVWIDQRKLSDRLWKVMLHLTRDKMMKKTPSMLYIYSVFVQQVR